MKGFHQLTDRTHNLKYSDKSILEVIFSNISRMKGFHQLTDRTHNLKYSDKSILEVSYDL